MQDEIDFIPTRQSLLSRLKNWDDHESWRSFFETYWRLIYKAAIKAGLNDAEAQDVVQETIVIVWKKMPTFRYDSNKGSFKGWLLRLTGWRISDQFRKRMPIADPPANRPDDGNDEAECQDLTPSVRNDLEEIWEQEWERNLVGAAMERVKKKVDPKHFQIFELHIVQGCSIAQISQKFNLNSARVYLIKHRVGNLVKKEITQLREKIT
jgi:RNA polymerase sigma factor (sigma-70 family)